MLNCCVGGVNGLCPASNAGGDPIAVTGRQVQQAVPGTLKDRVMGVFQGPLNGVSDGPRASGDGVNKPELLVGFLGSSTVSPGRASRVSGGRKWSNSSGFLPPLTREARQYQQRTQ